MKEPCANNPKYPFFLFREIYFHKFDELHYQIDVNGWTGNGVSPLSRLVSNIFYRTRFKSPTNWSTVSIYGMAFRILMLSIVSLPPDANAGTYP